MTVEDLTPPPPPAIPLDTLFHDLPCAAFMLDGDGRIRAVNAHLENISGYPAAQLLGRAFTDFVPAAHRERGRRVFTAVLGGDDRREDLMLTGADGRRRLLQITSTRTDGGVLCLAEDVTRQRRETRRLTLAADALAHTLEGIIITDAERRIVFVNRAFSEITGYTLEEMRNRPPAALRAGMHDNQTYEEIEHTLGDQGQWRGELWRKRKSGEAFPALVSVAAMRNRHGRITHFVDVFSDVSLYKDYERRLAYLAHRDPVTHLPNRTLFENRCRHALASARRRDSRMAVLFVDLDRFKAVNDSLGHHTGDLLLQMVAERLTAGVRESDTVARFGGDEFVVLVEDIQRPADAASVAGKLLCALNEPFACADQCLRIAASIGISCYPDDAADVDTLLRHADIAMYQAKDEGRERFAIYGDGREDAPAEAHGYLGAQLSRALERGELELTLRPLACLQGGQVTAVEAEPLWHSPEQGTLPYERLLDVAEKAGIAERLAFATLEAVCRRVRDWEHRLPAGFRVAVNLSLTLFRDPDIVRRIRAVIDHAGVAPERLVIEIAESALAATPGSAQRIAEALRACGLTVAIDHFGNGYASVRHLTAMPADTVKLDSLFVGGLPHDESDRRVMHTVAAMAQALNLKACALGVATEAQRRCLAEAGFEEGQGPLFGETIDFDALPLRRCG